MKKLVADQSVDFGESARFGFDLTSPKKAPNLKLFSRNWRPRETGPKDQPETALPSSFGGAVTPPGQNH